VLGREGVLICDGTSFLKQGAHSIGMARPYCGTLGKIANCDVAVTAALWTGARAWMLGGHSYLPEAWLTPEARQRARIPASVRFQEKWRLAYTLLRQASRVAPREAAVCVECVVDIHRLLRHTGRDSKCTRNRRSGGIDGCHACPDAGIQTVDLARDVAEHFVDQRPNGAERVIVGRDLLGRQVTNHRIGLAVVSSHARFGSTRSTICRSLN
jgi:hypothetical protein